LLDEFLIDGTVVFGTAFLITIVINSNGVINFGTAGIDEEI
jgi:hypothetical protein